MSFIQHESDLSSECYVIFSSVAMITMELTSFGLIFSECLVGNSFLASERVPQYLLGRLRRLRRQPRSHITPRQDMRWDLPLRQYRTFQHIINVMYLI